ncbi:MAG: AraC family transcriptional regulator N-terminal domain-containing protein [Acidobacteriota bacterium]
MEKSTSATADRSLLLSSIDVPVQSQIVEASEELPLLSVLLRLDMPYGP